VSTEHDDRAPDPGTRATGGRDGVASQRGNTIEWEVQRTEIFSDGVMAIGLTLLVLDLSVHGYRDSNLATTIISQWPTYVAFFMSFVYVAVMWMNHHAAFNRLRATSFALLWANMGILLGAVVLSYPTGVLAEAFQTGNVADERSAIVLYGALALLMGLSWTAFFFVVSRHPMLWKFEGDRQRWRTVTTWATFGALGYLVAIAAGLLIHPWVALIGFVVLLVYRSTQARRISRP
jgi:hypothetical protein